FLAVINVTVDFLAVKFLHVIGEEISNVFVGRPVGGHAQVVAVLGLEFFAQVRTGEPVGAKPVHIGKLLVGQLVQLAVGRRGELGADEILQVQAGVGPVLAGSGHVVGQRQDGAVPVVRADEVRIGDPAVIDGFS